MKMLSGDMLRLARIGKGWTLQELADRSQLSVSYLSHAEKNRKNVPDAVYAVLDIEEETKWVKFLSEYLNGNISLFPKDKEEIAKKLSVILGLNFNG